DSICCGPARRADLDPGTCALGVRGARRDNEKNERGEAMNAARAGLLLAFSSAACFAQGSGGVRPVTDEMLRDPDPADWLMWRRTLDGWGYSPLDQIDRENVA